MGIARGTRGGHKAAAGVEDGWVLLGAGAAARPGLPHQGLVLQPPPLQAGPGLGPASFGATLKPHSGVFNVGSSSGFWRG